MNQKATTKMMCFLSKEPKTKLSSLFSINSCEGDIMKLLILLKKQAAKNSLGDSCHFAHLSRHCFYHLCLRTLEDKTKDTINVQVTNGQASR